MGDTTGSTGRMNAAGNIDPQFQNNRQQDEQQQNATPKGSTHLGSLGIHPAMYGLKFTAVGAALHRRKNWDRPPNIGSIPSHAVSNEYQMLIVRQMVDAYMNTASAFDHGKYLGTVKNTAIESPPSLQVSQLEEGITARVDVEVQCWKMLEHMYQFYDFGKLTKLFTHSTKTFCRPIELIPVKGCKISTESIERSVDMSMSLDNCAGWDSRIETLIDHLKSFKCVMHDIMYETDKYWALFRAPNLMWRYYLQQRQKHHQSYWTQAQAYAM